MTKIQFSQPGRLAFILLLLSGFVLLNTEAVRAQPPRVEAACCLKALSSCQACKNFGASAKKRVIDWCARKESTSFVPGKYDACMDCIIGVCGRIDKQPSTGTTNNKPGKLKVIIRTFKETVHLGETHTFVAEASGGDSPYKFQWSGNNKTGGKASSVSRRSSIPIIFKQVGRFRVTVHVADSDRNVAQDSKIVIVLPRK